MIKVQFVIASEIDTPEAVEAISALTRMLVIKGAEWEFHVASTDHLKANTWELRFQVED